MTPQEPKQAPPTGITPEELARSAAFGGLQFCVTGVFKKITRQNIESLVLKHGGKIVNTVSRKTNYLVCGHILEDNRETKNGAKYKKAMQHSVEIISEAVFERFCQDKFRCT